MKALAFAVVAAIVPGVAGAQTSGDSTSGTDPRVRPVLMTEGSSLTDVVDALDMGSVWSFRFSASYHYTTHTATLQREQAVYTTPAGTNPNPDGTTQFQNLANFQQVTQTLNLGAELAVYHDFSLYFGVPIILSDQSTFTVGSSNGTMLTQAAVNQILADDYTIAGMPQQLFSLPFTTPNRSGIDQIAIGFNWDILNQARDPHVPTWLFRFQWRPPVGSALRPCQQLSTGQNQCPVDLSADAARPASAFDPGTNNVPNNNGYQRALQTSPDPGISRRVHGLYAQTIASRKLGYIEPYIGLDFLLEIPEGDTDTFRFGDAPYGQLATLPPIQGSFTVGTEITPWENRETWQRFSVDLRFVGHYWSQGRDYTPLFDPLGSSNSLGLTQPNFAINNLGSNPVFFTGTTSVESHASVTGLFAVHIQPVKWLRFTLGGSIMYTTPYLLTATDACNPNLMPSQPSYQGGCVGNSVPDPQHQPTIDEPGNRFRFVDEITWDLYATIAFTPRL